MLRKLVLGLAAAVALAGCGGSAAPSGSGSSSSSTCGTPLTFTVRLNWVLDDEQVPYYTALDRGWYRDACLDPQFQPGRGSSDTVQLVANGSADVGIADSVAIVAGQAQGMDVTAFGVIYNHNPTAFLIRKAALPADQQGADRLPVDALSGKTYGAVITGSPFIFWKGFAKKQGLDGKVRQVNISPPGFAEMATGRVDFIATFFTTAPVLEGMGVPLRVFKLEDYGQKAYGLSFLGGNKFLDAHPVQMRKFLEVTQRAIEFTNKNPEAGVRALCKSNQALCADDKALSTNVDEQRLQIPLYSNPVPGRPMFCADTTTWQATQQLLLDAGTITRAPDPAKTVTNRFLSGC